MKDNEGKEEKVVLRKAKPQDFERSEQIVLTGKVEKGQFIATDMLMKCPSKYKDEEITDIDGVKIDFPESWVHLRKSNTEPIIRIYSESENLATAEHLTKKIISDIRELITDKGEE